VKAETKIDRVSEDRTESKKVCVHCREVFDRRAALCPRDGTILIPELVQEKDPLIGTVFSDRYKIVSVMGQGSLSVVYLAKHQLIDRMMAVKVLRANLAADQHSLVRFEGEAHAASRLHHPNVVSVHDFGLTEAGQPYLVVDYVQGNNLAEIIKCAGCIE